MDVPLRPLLLGLGWLVGWFLLWRVRGVPAVEGSTANGDVSVVIPARDEARNLPRLLEALALQTAPPAEIVVVDDASEDATAAVATAAGIRLVTGTPVPPGWAGKSWALWQGAGVARYATVVFLDADTIPAPHLLERLVGHLGRVGGLVSVQPYHWMRRWWERGAAFFNVVAVMGAGIGSVRAPRRAEPVAFGPCMACARAAFLEHGDHESVRGAVVEDVALARRFAAAGLAVGAFAGRHDLAFRMYDRPGALVEGFAKNIAAGAGSTPPVRLALVIGWVTAALAATGGLWALDAVGLVAYAAFAVQLTLMLRQLGTFGVTGVVYPVPAVMFVAVFAWSVVLLARGQVRWKGRTIRVRGT